MNVRGKRVLVVGLARSGQAVTLGLRRHGAEVTATDLRSPSEFRDVIPQFTAQKIGLELGVHREETFLRRDLIVVSPGVPLDLPQLEAARRRLIPVVPEIEVAGWFLKGTLVGITGTNGKTTTTALLGAILKSSGFPTFVGGNIGTPLSSAVDQVSTDSLIVAELSSFQLEIIRDFHTHVAVLLNLTRNHLDRHASFDAYVRAKARIFANQTAEDYAILNADDPQVMSLVPHIESRKIYFSRTQNLPAGVLVSGGRVLYRVGNLERDLFEIREVQLRGAFNVENVLAAAAAACQLGADFDVIRATVREFRGVEHRLEYVREIHGVEFYNDSKATSVDATAKALSAFDRDVLLILGGKDKGAPYAPLRPLLEKRARYVFVIGAAADRIARELSGAVEILRASDLETAVRQASKLADPGAVVLLSPACASFDQFQNFEHRGRVFKDVVARLAREVEKTEVGNGNRESPPGLRNKGAMGANSIPESSRPKPAGGAIHESPGPGLTKSVYLYELHAEEVAPLALAPPADFVDAESIALEDLRSIESIEDEALPFEIRGAADLSKGQKEGVTALTPAACPPSGVSSPKSLRAAASNGQHDLSPGDKQSLPKDSGGRSRLPEM